MWLCLSLDLSPFLWISVDAGLDLSLLPVALPRAAAHSSAAALPSAALALRCSLRSACAADLWLLEQSCSMVLLLALQLLRPAVR
nr:unnamed protein product [Digitaria exilis]